MTWTEKHESSQKSQIPRIKEFIISLLSRQKKQTLVEDRYELEACKTLKYEDVSGWILKNKTDEADGALLVRLREEQDLNYPIVIAIMFLQNNHVLLGRENMKKIVHCKYLEEELNAMFAGKESLIIR